MKIVVLTNSRENVVGSSLANGDERVLAHTKSLNVGLSDLGSQIDADTLADLAEFAASKIPWRVQVLRADGTVEGEVVVYTTLAAAARAAAERLFA